MTVVYQPLLSGISRIALEQEMNARPLRQGSPHLSPVRRFIGEPCPYCATPMQFGGPNGVTRDHAHHPKSQGGVLCERNRVIACRTCNGDKRDRTLVEWHDVLKRGLDRRATLVLAMIESERAADESRGLQSAD